MPHGARLAVRVLLTLAVLWAAIVQAQSPLPGSQDVYLPLLQAELPTPTVTATVPPAATATMVPTQGPAPTPTRNPAQCHPSYPTVCIPPPPPDLDCSDIPYRRFIVLPPDPHNFDTDHDGIGCESG